MSSRPGCSRAQRRIIVPAALLSFAPMAAFAASPGLVMAVGLLALAGPGNAWTAGFDGLLIDTAPLTLRNRALALAGAGMMFTQGAGFALWGIAGHYIPPTAAIPSPQPLARSRPPPCAHSGHPAEPVLSSLAVLLLAARPCLSGRRVVNGRADPRPLYGTAGQR